MARMPSLLRHFFLFALSGLFFLAPRELHAQTFNIYETSGVLENGWADWSWCSDNFKSTKYVNKGPYSIEVTYTSGWQGFFLNANGSFPATYFSALAFNINGGATSSRTINVVLTVNGSQSASLNLNKYIAGGSVAANTWRKVSIPLADFKLKPTDTISQVLLQEGTGAAQPPFYVDQIGWTPNVPTGAISINVGTATNQRLVDPKMFGVNTAVWDNNFTSSTCKDLISKGGFKAYRFPGGSLSDGYNWQTNKTDSNTWEWATNFDAFASVAAHSSMGQCFITTNYGTGSASEAAAWVRYSNIVKRYGLKYWEVGNECYGNWEEDTHAVTHDPVTYANQFALYYKQMKAVDPTINVGAVAVPGEDAYANYPNEAVTNPRTNTKHSGWTAVMLATLAKAGVTPDFVILHRYPEYVVDCDFTLLVGNSGWLIDISDLRQQLRDYLGTKNTKTQIMCTENNADAGTPGKQLCSLVNALYLADGFGTLLQTECNSFMWWDLINGQSTNSADGPWLYGWRPYGDEGMFSPDFTQVYPIYYAEQMLNLFAAPRDKVLTTTSTYGLLTAYSTKRADGTIRVMVINKNSTASLTGAITLAGFTPAAQATQYFYGMPNDNAASIGQSQAVTQSTISNAATKTTIVFPPYSITVIAFNPK